jgi:hypothetical protein
MTATPNSPNRTFSFTPGKGSLLHWVDTWYSRCDRRWVSSTSQVFSLPGLLGLPESRTYWDTTFDSTGRILSRKQAVVDLWLNGTVTFGPAGQSMVRGSASWTHTEAVQQSSSKAGPGGNSNLVVGSNSKLVLGTTKNTTITVSDGGFYDVARDASIQGSALAILRGGGVGGGGSGGGDIAAEPGLAATIPGDFRRPKWARHTAALTDDELWAVNYVAGSHGLSGPQLMAILLELTGARRVAYHPEGFYGVSNLSAAMLRHWLSVDQFGAAFSGQVSGIGSVQDFLSASVYRQLIVTDGCLRANLGGQSGVIPVFLLLATGAVSANAGPATTFPAPLPPRLQPLSGDGTTLMGADIAARIAARAALLEDEFARRLPAVCAPPPGATRLMPNQALYPNQSISSLNGQFTLIYQSDGNLVLYHNGVGAVWASNSVGSTPGYAVMQGDGNLVVYDGTNRGVWASNTAAHPGALLAVQNAGFVAIISSGNAIQLWRN